MSALRPVDGLRRLAARPVYGLHRRNDSDGPGLELDLGNYTIPQPFWAAVVLGLVFTVLIFYPFIEQRLTKDKAVHDLLQRPRDVPVRTSLGAMAGVETGVIRRDAYGDYVELHQPLAGVDEHVYAILLDYQGAPLPKKINKLGSVGTPARGSLFRPDVERTAHRGQSQAMSGKPRPGTPSAPRG